MNMRAFTISAVSNATHSGAPSPKSVVATICEAPALTSTDIPIASATPKPAWMTAAPATSPKGTMPTVMGATSFMPARMLWVR